jgi:transposase
MEILTLTRLELERIVLLRRCQEGLTQAQVAAQLGISERHVRRLLRRLEVDGDGGIASRKRGRPSNNRLEPSLVAAAVDLVRQHYDDFGPTFANEKLRERHGIVLSTETLRKAMIEAGLWEHRHRPQPRFHPMRVRRPCRGELVQVDGSHHAWFEERAAKCVLLTDVDDATSAIVAAHFDESESMRGYFALIGQLVNQHGRPLALYTDRHATFTPTRPSINEQRISQVGRALGELDIELICATSPQAKGRVERAHQTLQNRLLRELRLNTISSIGDANAYLPKFVRDYNARFSIEPASESNAFRSADGLALESILAERTTRVVSKTLTFSFDGRRYQLVDVVLPARLRGATIDIRCDGPEVIAERRGQRLRFVPLDTGIEQAAIVEPHQLANHLSNRRPQKPGPDHPWRKWRLTSPPG